MAEQRLNGISAARGIAIGPAYLIRDQVIEIDRDHVKEPSEEVDRLDRALQRASSEIKALKQKAQAETSAEEAAIFDAHALFLQDPALIEMAHEKLHAEGINAESAWEAAIEFQAAQLSTSESEYIRERSTDLRDVGRRVTRLLVGGAETDFSGLTRPSVIVARDLAPSDTVRLDKDLVLAFCTAEGGPTSHTAILARSLGIPAVVGLGEDFLHTTIDADLAVDGQRGLVIVDPSNASVQLLQRARQTIETQQAEDWAKAQEPAMSRDGRQVEIVANVGNQQDASLALDAGAEGIGLLRTEFLYMDRELGPSEEEQGASYKAILDVMEDRRVIVRTLDIGGDKDLPYIDLQPEDNPFLGVRALRLCFQHPDLLAMQLRSLLRVSWGHNVHIMFPMVATLEELRRAREALEEARRVVLGEGYRLPDRIPLGIMVEIPSVAVMADQFAREVDFFSIGTNDLTQYTFAAERTNAQVAHLTDALHPAVLRLIRQVVESAHRSGIWTGICGELAGDPDAIPLLLGLNLDELSMAPHSIPRAKAIIRTWDSQTASSLVEAALDTEDAQQVRNLVRQQADHQPE